MIKSIFGYWWHRIIVQNTCLHHNQFSKKQQSTKNGPREVIFYHQDHVCQKCGRVTTVIGGEDIEYHS